LGGAAGESAGRGGAGQSDADEAEGEGRAAVRRRLRRVALASARACVWAVALLSVASLFGRRPFFELATHFRLQYALASTACAAALACARSWKTLLLAAACAAFGWACVVPYYSRGGHEARDPAHARLVVMFANVEGGNTEYGALLDSVGEVRPDVLALAEVTPEWWARVGPALAREYPYAEALPKQGGSGLALFSRFPLEGAEAFDVDASTHPLMRARVMLPRATLRLLLMHPTTPLRTDKFAYRSGQFERAAELMNSGEGPRALVGDLNATPWSPYFRDLLTRTRLRDVRAGAGLLPTWPAYLPAFLRIPIDHCLVSPDVRVYAARTGPRTGSDHLPLVVELGLPPKGE
jgi:endonuclease/exonuclease/phosphatase (EEP) superfamily protein YafD